MGDLTANLSRHEFDCPCDLPQCSRTPVDYVLVTTIQTLADRFFAEASDEYGDEVVRISVSINSGLRCKLYDKAMKLKNGLDFNGKKVSEHVWGIAADFKFEIVFQDGTRELIHPDRVVDHLEKEFPNSCGIGQYIGRTHFDTRPEKARWDNR